MLPQTRLKSTLNTSPAHAAIVQFAKDWGVAASRQSAAIWNSCWNLRGLTVVAAVGRLPHSF